MFMKVKKGDTVLIIAGKDRGKTGKVIEALPKVNKIVVEGVNIRKKHMRPRRAGEKGQIIEIFAPLDVSNAKLICPKCSKATRVGYKVIQTQNKRRKVRVCKKCLKEID
jgi:large subunit ribosomal protein L24